MGDRGVFERREGDGRGGGPAYQQHGTRGMEAPNESENRQEDAFARGREYIALIRRDPFLGKMLGSYDWAGRLGGDLEALDYGCGYGWGSYVLAGSCRRVTGYDPDRERIEFAESVFKGDNLRFCREEGELEGKSYDLVCLFMVLPHVKGGEKLSLRLREYIKPGGFLYLSYKRDSRGLPGAFRPWEPGGGFRLLERRQWYLTQAENLVECSYCRER